jgi:hypothetical protein
LYGGNLQWTVKVAVTSDFMLCGLIDIY